MEKCEGMEMRRIGIYLEVGLAKLGQRANEGAAGLEAMECFFMILRQVIIQRNLVREVLLAVCAGQIVSAIQLHVDSNVRRIQHRPLAVETEQFIEVHFELLICSLQRAFAVIVAVRCLREEHVNCEVRAFALKRALLPSNSDISHLSELMLN